MIKQNLEYEIGHVNGDPAMPSKFIVYRNKNKLMINTAEFFVDSAPYLGEDCAQDFPTYSKIVKDNKINTKVILGGGYFRLGSVDKRTGLILDGCSSRFGSVPVEAAKQVGKKILGVIYTEPSGIEVVVEMPQYFKPDKAKIWKELGFEVK